ncbi:hypothetical protein MNBD_NITROSPINAE01-588 [hydrothermal vent metagenome]|uniref:FeoB-type G domain-containing protein n=1 Tax=hydrothermal vent metagenome TaxID=652676 RepID=A0A3B1CDR5_9ZZZZ
MLGTDPVKKEKPVEVKRTVKKIAIIGPANSGKSVVFNKLSGSYSIVANYSQTTIEFVRKECKIADARYEIWDTPGLASFITSSQDESDTRDALLKTPPDIILFVGDATRMKRSLTLFAQVMELGIPTVFILNKTDAAQKRGTLINAIKLSARLRVPVVEAVATHGIGFDKMSTAIKTTDTEKSPVRYPEFIEESLAEIQNALLEDDTKKLSKTAAVLYLSGDKNILKWCLAKFGEDACHTADEAVLHFHRKSPAANVKQVIFNARSVWADNTAEASMATATLTAPRIAQTAAWASRHPIWGWPIVIAIMWTTFYGVGTLAARMAGFLDTWFFFPVTDFISSLIGVPLLNDFFVGDFGIITMGIMNALGTVVPILTVFFLIVNFLEDVGYLPNLSVMANRIFSYFGLTGKAVLSMSLGFGCNTMATMTSRMLETKKERIIASFLIALGVPCAVQLGVMLAILASAPFSAILFVVGTVVITQMVCGVLLNKMLKSDKASDFIMELPAFKLPNFKNIVKKTYFRVKWFLKEALPLFVLGAMLMFTLEKTGLLTTIEALASPVITGILSLPDKATEVFILVLSRRELGAVYFKNMFDAGEVDYYQVVVGLTVMTLFIPCASNTMAMLKELGLKVTAYINLSIIAIAISVGGALNILVRLF